MGLWENIQLRVGGVDARVRAMEQMGASSDPRQVDAISSAALEDKSPLVQKAAAEALGKLGDPRGIPALTTMLQRGQPEVQKAAALALEKIGGVQAVAPLAGAITGLYPEVRQAAMQGLVAIGPPALGPLISLLKDLNREARRTAAEALGRIGAPAVMPLLAQLKDKDPELRKLVIEILLKIGKPAVEAMAAGLADPNPDTRRMTADSLGKIGDPKALPILGEALQDSCGSVREAAARAMELLGWQPEGDAETAIRAVALRDWNQAASLGVAAVPPLVAALKDPDPRLAEAATDTLTKVGPAAAPALLEILKDENPTRRSQAARALGEMRITEAAPDLIEALRDPDGTVRENVVLALWRMGGPEAITGLTQALKDPDGLIRSRAARALGEIHAEQAVEALLQLAENDPYARSAAALAVWKLAPVKAVKPLALWAAEDGTADEAIIALTQLLEQSASSVAAEDLYTVRQLLQGHAADRQAGRVSLVKRADPSIVCSLAEKELARRAT